MLFSDFTFKLLTSLSIHLHDWNVAQSKLENMLINATFYNQFF